MPECTWGDVLGAIRARLSDTQVSGGEVFTNAVLQPYAAQAYREMYRALQQVGSARIRRHWYYNVPALTQQIKPSALGLTDMAEPETIEERGGLRVANITSYTADSPIVITATGHGFHTGDEPVVSGTSTQAPLGRWFCTVVDPNTLTLNGSVGDSTGTGGTLTESAEHFSDPIKAREDLPDHDPSERLTDWVWEENVIRFRGATEMRQIRVTYIASGTAPALTSTTLAIDDCLDFVATRAAAIAAGSKGWNSVELKLNREALGPKFQADGSGGLLSDFVALQVLKMQREQRRRRPYRTRNNNPGFGIW